MQRQSKGALTVTAYAGDFRTLLTFDMSKAAAKGLAGFSIQAQPKDGSTQPFFLLNTLRFERPGDHATDQAQSARLSLNAPFQKFRWLHVPGQFHQGLKPFQGAYDYTVTPRFFDDSGAMAAIDNTKSVSVTIDVKPFRKQALSLGFCRGFTQSQAFVHHFGPKAVIRPPDLSIDFDTDTKSGTSAELGDYTYRQEYEWLGGTARVKIFELLDAVVADPSLRMDLFAYDLNEPDIIDRLLTLAKQKRLRVVLDNAKLHHDSEKPTFEDEFEDAFVKADGHGNNAPIVRGKFGNFAHDKCFIISDAQGNGVRVLTGSTNFSVTGIYVNSNHVLIFDDPGIAKQYKTVFEEAFNDGCTTRDWLKTDLSSRRYKSTSSPNVPPMSVTFAPHSKTVMQNVLGRVVDRIKEESKRTDGSGSVLFAVMELGGTSKNPNMVEDTLRGLHQDGSIYTYGITDTKAGIRLYKRGEPNGVLVTGRPINTVLPPPFDQVPNITNPAAHQVHHKFVVCGFNGPDPTVFCGSSNLAEGGEQKNGDNLLEIHDADVVTAFTIEAVGMIDHFDFLDSTAKGAKGQPSADQSQDAVDAEMFLDSTDEWAQSYFDPDDFHFKDRELFAS